MTTAENEPTIQKAISRRGLLKLAGLTSAAALFEACGNNGPTVASATSSASPTPTETGKAAPTLDVRKPTPTQNIGATSADIGYGGSGITGFEAQRPPWVDLERKWQKGDEAKAAEMYGRDKASRDPANWEVNNQGGVMLKPVSKGIPYVYRVFTDDSVLEEWLEVPERPENTQHNAIVFIAPPDLETDIRGGTFWPFGRSNIRGAIAQVKWDVTQKELVGRNGKQAEQPGVKINEICPAPSTQPPAK